MKLEYTRFCAKQWQAFLDFNLLLISLYLFFIFNTKVGSVQLRAPVDLHCGKYSPVLNEYKIG
jgi:hypothetical protein